jgi:hypothetical protein
MSITIPTGDLTGILTDTIPFAFPKDDLPALNVVRLEWDSQALHAITTDRHRLAWSTWEPGDLAFGEDAQDDLFTEWGSGDNPWRCTLQLADAAEIAKVFKLGWKESRVPLTVDYEADRHRLTVKRTKETGHSAITISAEDTFSDEFPDVRKLLAAADKLTARRDIDYNAAYLADFAKVRPRGPLSMRHTKTLTHVSIGERFIGAIMPVALRADEKPLRSATGLHVSE